MKIDTLNVRIKWNTSSHELLNIYIYIFMYDLYTIWNCNISRNNGRDYNSHMNKKNAKICVLEKGIGG